MQRDGEARKELLKEAPESMKISVHHEELDGALGAQALATALTGAVSVSWWLSFSKKISPQDT